MSEASEEQKSPEVPVNRDKEEVRPFMVRKTAIMCDLTGEKVHPGEIAHLTIFHARSYNARGYLELAVDDYYTAATVSAEDRRQSEAGSKAKGASRKSQSEASARTRDPNNRRRTLAR